MRKALTALLLALLLAPAPAVAQINWNVTYADVTNNSGIGFADGSAAGATTVGQLRQDSVTAAFGYMGTVLDGRGNVRLNFDASSTSGSGFLAQFGAQGVAAINGTFQNGAVYQRARTNDSYTFPSSPGGPLTSDGSGQVNFGYNWHYGVTGTTTTLNSGTYDLVSVLAHEIGHSLGISAYSAPNGTGLNNRPLGSTDVYSAFDCGLQRGNVAGANPMLNSNIASSNYGSYNTAVSTGTYTGGNSQAYNGTTTTVTNNATSGLYFNGKYANEAFGGVIPIYAPTTFASGSSGSHVNVGTTSGYGSGAVGLMNYAVDTNTQRRFQAYEIGMLMDLGWNVYNWNGTTGNMKDGVNTDGSFALSSSRWTTDSGIVLAANGGTTYNTNANQAQAPILPVYGQTTANIVLNFAGTTYTATNDIGTIRASRLTFASTGAVTIAGGAFNFGLNADGTASVLVPKIVQGGAGAVTISSNLQVNTIGTQTVLGSTFAGHNGLTVEGTGTGDVTLSGNITGTGGLTKNGAFTMFLGGTGGTYTGSTYSGGTAINAGELNVTNTVAGSSGTGTGAVTVNATATLSGIGTIGGAVTVNAGGTIRGGSGLSGQGNGTLTLGGATLNGASGTSGATLALDLAQSSGSLGSTTYSKLAFGGGTFNIANVGSGNKFNVKLLNDGNLSSVTNSFTLILATGTGGYLRNGAAATGANAFLTSDFNLISGTGTWTFQTVSLTVSGNDLVLQFQPVPEPATVLAIGAAGLGAVTWLRRRHAAAPANAA